MLDLDPRALAQRQLRRDRARTAEYSGMLEHKIARMSSSPFAFLRGSAPLYYELLEARRGLAKGPPGKGWICGDAHLENFGAYRPDAGGGEEVGRAVFHLNDFDEAVRAPLRFDLLRLLTSLILVARELGADGPATLEACHAMLHGYVGRALDDAPAAEPPAVVQALLSKVSTRTRKDLLDARTQHHGKVRRFVRGERYRDLPAKLVAAAKKAFARYVEDLDDAERPTEEQAEVMDTAFRIAGTGSLGVLRIALLVHGKGGADGQWVFDMKEEDRPSAAALVGRTGLAEAERVVEASRACLEHPPRKLGTTRLKGRSMLVRPLAPQEDRIVSAELPVAAVRPLAGYLGSLLGEAHRRGATALPDEPWGRSAREELLDRAIALAAVHEAAWLSYCRLAADAGRR
jgi:uncharacterized protein (DUF2252 family)